VQTTSAIINFQSELVITTIEELAHIKGGTKFVTIFWTLSLPTKLVEVHVVIVNFQVEELEIPIIPKPIPLTIPQIGVGTNVTLNITHAFEVFKIPNIKLKDTLVIEKPKPELVTLVEPVDTSSGNHVDDLVASVK